MPASTISPDLNCNNAPNSGLEDQRALQLALELTMLGLHSPDSELDCNEYDINDELNKKRSQNMTECVPVPSSEHVAEIVGRQGCKIKALRAKTNTYIKTPVRGEEPVFVVTGRKEDVGDAKREILSAAEHFSQIRASRRNNNHGGTVNGLCPPSPNSPGQVTLQVRVPYRVVGLVVGPKGATIKRIQQLTHTYIVTPSRDKEPVFEVTGKAEHVEKARIEIEKHIAMRTGGLLLENGVTPDDIESNGYEIDQLNNEQLQSRMNSAYNVYNAMNNNVNLQNGNHVLATAARQSQLIMQDYNNLNAASNKRGGGGDPFHDSVGFGNDLVYDPYSSLLNGRYPPRPEDDLLSTTTTTTSQCAWNAQQIAATMSSNNGGWPVETTTPTQQQRIIYGKMASSMGATATTVVTTPSVRRNSLESSPHLSPGSDHGLQTHATIRRISSDPVSASETANAWNSFQAIEFGAGFGNNGIQSHDESPPIQDN